VSDHYVAFIE